MTPNHRLTRTLLAIVPLMAATRAAHAYIDLAPTFSKIVADSPNIELVEVTSYDAKAHSVTLKPVQALKGAMPSDAIVHQIAPDNGVPPRQVIEWAVPGSRAV